MSVVYVLHPGPVRSATDGQTHFISSAQLARLYGLKRHQYVVWYDSRPWSHRWLTSPDHVHLYPR